MKTRRKHRVAEIEWPQFGPLGRPPEAPSATELRQRIDRALAAMEQRGLTHLVVYADREHFANLAFLTHFDPRFEEALLVLSRTLTPLMLVGNECKDYLPISPLHAENGFRTELYQPFSLMDQPREKSRTIEAIFRDEAIGNTSRVGCVGWKYFSEREHPDSTHAINIPAFLVDTLRSLAGRENVVNATSIFIDANDGLRTFCSARDIAYFEYANMLSSEAVRRILCNVKEGLTDHELAQQAQYDGTPLCAYLNVKTGAKTVSLASPSGNEVRRGNRLSCNVAHWGSNVCRTGWVAESAADLPVPARDYVPAFAGLYFEAMAAWFGALDIGAPAAECADVIAELLPQDVFNITLNPGHLIHLDEWISSPFYRGSTIRLHSGMAIQSDVIPSSKVYGSTRMEDGYVPADATLRRELSERFPETWSRCQARRKFMTDVLGIDMSDAVLPLSNIPAVVPPFFLSPGQLIVLER